MALLHGLLFDLRQRCKDLSSELALVLPQLPGEAAAYANRIETLLSRAAARVESLLSDPDFPTPAVRKQLLLRLQAAGRTHSRIGGRASTGTQPVRSTRLVRDARSVCDREGNKLPIPRAAVLGD